MRTDNLPSRLYSSAQVRALDARIIDGGTPGRVLMQRAARAIFNALAKRWPQAQSLCVFCGKGNNGGDGFLLARIAADKGYAVRVVELGFSDKDREQSVNGESDAQLARQALLATGIKPLDWQQSRTEIIEALDTIDIVVDAMLGTGINGTLRSGFEDAIAVINQQANTVVAVDIPSGISSDSGLKLGKQAVEADITVTFIGLKKGQFTADAKDHIGELVFDDLQADSAIAQDQPCDAQLSQLSMLAERIPQRHNTAYKNSSGHLLVIGGDTGMGGAALLTASAAVCCGTGLVSVATRVEHTAAIVASQPELMAKGIGKTLDVVRLLDRASAVVIGPGLGVGPWSQQLLVHTLMFLLENKPMPLLLDADALNLLASRPEIYDLFSQLQSKHPYSAILTPHLGEAERLIERKIADRFELVSELEKKYTSTIVLKGAGTLIAKENQTRVCSYGNAVLATAGSGDVLSGVIGAWLAQQLPTFEAAELGVCLHAAAADEYLATQGEKGMTAGDLPYLMVDVLNELTSDETHSDNQ